MRFNCNSLYIIRRYAGRTTGKVFRIGLMGSSSTEENVKLIVDALGNVLAAEHAAARLYSREPPFRFKRSWT